VLGDFTLYQRLYIVSETILCTLQNIKLEFGDNYIKTV